MSRIHDALQRAEQEKLAAAATNTARVDQADSEKAYAQNSASLTASDHEVKPVADMLFAAVGQAATSTTPDLHDRIKEAPPSPWSPDARRLVFWNTNGHAPVGAEEFRTLRSRLYRIREKQPLKTVLVASAVAGEGKTFVSCNLGQALARQRSRRILLIDCDLRKPALHTWFGASPSPGVTEYLQDNADEATILQRSPKDNLYLIPAGKTVSNPAELLSNGRLNMLLERVAPTFDWIIFDTSPILPVSDAAQIATVCDGVLLVVLANSTPLELAQRAGQEFRHAPAILGVVLNQVDKHQTYASYRYEYRPPQVETK